MFIQIRSCLILLEHCHKSLKSWILAWIAWDSISLRTTSCNLSPPTIQHSLNEYWSFMQLIIVHCYNTGCAGLWRHILDKTTTTHYQVFTLFTHCFCTLMDHLTISIAFISLHRHLYLIWRHPAGYLQILNYNLNLHSNINASNIIYLYLIIY